MVFNSIDQYVVDELQLFRDLLWISTGKEIPLTVTCGLRCEAHNEAVSGTKHSYHMAGMAVDITFGHIPFVAAGRIIYLAKKREVMRVGAIGVYPDRNFIHLDIRDGTFTTWTNINGQYRYGVNFQGT